MKLLILGAILAALFCAAATESAGQQLRKQRRQPDRVEVGNKLAPSAGKGAEVKEPAPAEQKNRFAGISQSDPREFNRRFFSRQERQMLIHGLGRPVVYLIVLRQLNLTAQQKEGIKAISQRVGLQFRDLKQQYAQLANELDESIYGEAFDPKRIEELSAQAGQKQAEITRLQANIEAEFRQILTPDQHFVFRYLIGEMLLPQRRILNRLPRRVGRVDN
jgi:LTXXQ motif family protein